MFWEEAVVVSAVSVESADSVSCSRAARMVLPWSGHMDLWRKDPQERSHGRAKGAVSGERRDWGRRK